jgi:hypothetical protein
MRVCIHRAAEQIGGSSVEVEDEGSRIILDLGLPLDTMDDMDAALLPPIPDLLTPHKSLLPVCSPMVIATTVVCTHSFVLIYQLSVERHQHLPSM